MNTKRPTPIPALKWLFRSKLLGQKNNRAALRKLVQRLRSELRRVRSGNVHLREVLNETESLRRDENDNLRKKFNEIMGHLITNRFGRKPFLMTQHSFEYRVLKSGILDERWYLAEYTDVSAAGLDPVRHYLNFGAAEGRAPNAFFDTVQYLADYPDVAQSGMNPLVHYCLYGASEGRNGVHRLKLKKRDEGGSMASVARLSAELENYLFDPRFAKNWHMSLSERAGLIQVLAQRNPSVSIEIGTFQGGSLRPISHFSSKVYTFDIDPNQRNVAAQYHNVEFVAGDSRTTLGPLIDALNKSHQELEFVLIDGSHETDGVRSDIVDCLKYIPKRNPLVILLHDSWNPAVRNGIVDAPWSDCPHAHVLELDFVPGLLFDRADIKGQIWGGLAAALLLPENRSGAFNIKETYSYTRATLLNSSIYSTSSSSS